MAILSEDVIIRILVDSGKATKDIRTTDAELKKLGKSGITSSASIAKFAGAMSLAALATELVVKAVTNHINKIKEAEKAYIALATSTKEYTSGAIQSYLDLEIAEDKLATARAKRWTDRLEWYRKWKAARAEEQSLLIESEDLINFFATQARNEGVEYYYKEGVDRAKAYLNGVNTTISNSPDPWTGANVGLTGGVSSSDVGGNATDVTPLWKTLLNDRVEQFKIIEALSDVYAELNLEYDKEAEKSALLLRQLTALVTEGYDKNISAIDGLITMIGDLSTATDETIAGTATLVEQLRTGFVGLGGFQSGVENVTSSLVDLSAGLAMTESDAKSLEETMFIVNASISNMASLVSGYSAIASGYYQDQLSALRELRNQTYLLSDAELSAIEDKTKAEQERYDALSDSEKQRIKDMEEAAQKALDLQKGLQIAQAIASGATAIIRAFADLGPIGGAIATPFIATLTALQVATIKDQQLPSYATGTPEGGYTVPPGFEDDSYPVRAASGERVTVDRPGQDSGEMLNVVLNIDGYRFGQVMTRAFKDRKAFVPTDVIMR